MAFKYMNRTHTEKDIIDLELYGAVTFALLLR